MNVALFGGSFDPPHIGHVLAAAYARATGEFERLLVVPVYAHAFEKPLSPFPDRLAMTRLAMSGLAETEVSPVEASLGAPSRTLRTVQHLLSEHPEYRLRLVVGSDVLGETGSWLSFERVIELSPLFVLDCRGFERAGTPAPVLPAVSSTDVRARLRACQGPRAADTELRQLVPRAVLQYIDERALYR